MRYVLAYWRQAAFPSAVAAAVVGFVACSDPNGSNATAAGPGAGNGGGLGGAGGSALGGMGASASGGNGLIVLPDGGTAPASGGTGTVLVDGDLGPALIDNCPGTLPQSQVDALKAGGSAAGMRYLYPYADTVFPRGLLGPTLQWAQPGAADAVYVHLKSLDFEYHGCFGPNQALQMPIDQLAWDAAGNRAKGLGDPLSISITTLSGGTVYGPLTIPITFALARLKGALFYNTYMSQIAGQLSNPPQARGAVMKLVPGQVAPTPFLYLNPAVIQNSTTGPCISCHSLSANGAMMTANEHNYLPGGASYVSRSYDVTSGTPVIVKDPIGEAGFAGLYPDGSKAMTNGPPSASISALFPLNPGSATQAANVPALIGPATARLIDTRTGADISTTGWTAPHAQMPMFSPDGRHIVYNDADQDAGHSLFAADFDNATNAFTNVRRIFNHGTAYPGWPFFTPDGQSVIFVLGTRTDYVSQLPDPITGMTLDTVGRSHLEIVYLSSPGVSTPLGLTNGYRNGQSYLPQGTARDNDYEFFSTVSPISAGGYFWLFFTGRRTYGNVWTPQAQDPLSKKAWGAAISIGGTPGTDPSHPAFFVDGQELQSGNLRVFAALEPCKEDGGSCTNGTECCGGFCTKDANGQNGVCMKPTVPTCAGLDEKCTTSADCCATPAGMSCLGQYCGFPIPQ